jgi:outer membrane protein assembly factor BamA
MRTFTFFVFFLVTCTIYAQKPFWLKTQYFDTKGIVSEDKKVRLFSDSLKVLDHIQSGVVELKKKGFFMANLDSLVCKADTCIAHVYKGSECSFLHLEIDTTGMTSFEKNLNQKKWKAYKNNPEKWPEFAGELTNFYLSQGYPFSRVYLSDIIMNQDKIVAKCKIEKGLFIQFDSIVNKGNLKINNNFIYRYFLLKPGAKYDHFQVANLSKKSKNLLFANSFSEPKVVFDNNLATVHLFLNRSPVNKFDFILGILPNNNPVTGAKKWVISGDLKSEFYNRFGQGEYIFGQYKKLQPENQEIILKFSIPYVYNFAFGLDTDFRLFRNGNQHLDLLLTAGIQYLFKGLSNVKFGYHYKSSRLIDINVESIKNSGKLPANLDIIYRSGVLNIQMFQTDYRFNPTRGFLLDVRCNAGQKVILENSVISAIEGFENIYENVKKPTLQVETDLDLQYFIPLKNYGTFRLRGMAGLKYNSFGIRQNEYFRLGGSATLRGFDEESIWTDRYFVVSSEFRLFLDRNSFLSLPFFDYALTRILVDEKIQVDRAYGVGLGINFSTRAGIFNVSFAAGSRLQSPLDFGNMKVHFGYVSLF